MQFSPFLPSLGIFLSFYFLVSVLFLGARNFDIIQGRAARLAEKYESLRVSLQYSLVSFSLSLPFPHFPFPMQLLLLLLPAKVDNEQVLKCDQVLAGFWHAYSPTAAHLATLVITSC